MKHISIRVPWHDKKWNGQVCEFPSKNPFCRTLPHISELKNDATENGEASMDWCKLCPKNLPACKGENGAFMNPFSYTREMKHAYGSYWKYPHHNLLPTILEYPPFSFAGMPFRYMSNNNREEIDKKCPDLDEDVEGQNRTWVYGAERQTGILNWFSSQISSEGSLVIFYVKNGNPVDDESRRMIVGLGEVTRIYGVTQYESKVVTTFPMWELLMQHSIRPNLKESKGFLLPYQEYLKLDDQFVIDKTGISKYKALDEIKLTIDKLGDSQRILNELSYGCEFVSNHSMLIILTAALECIKAVRRHGLVGGDWTSQINWINDQIAKVKSMIGPFPSFAECLEVMGVNFSYIIEQDLRNKGYLKIKDNPWLVYEKLLNGEINIKDAPYSPEIITYRETWKHINPKQKEVLELLSRFELGINIIEKWIGDYRNYDNLISNPYIISEAGDPNEGGYVSTSMIDVGVIPEISIQGDWQPKTPTRLETKIDPRRIRSMAIFYIKNRLMLGDTLVSIAEISGYIEKTLKEDDNYKLPVDYIITNKVFFEEKLTYVPDKEENLAALQLNYFNKIEKQLSKLFKARASKSVKNKLDEDWETIIEDAIDNFDKNNQRSVDAVKDQVKVLQIISDKKLSVLMGPAGTGKTTVVKAFLKSPQIQKEGVLLLAPTGKARVRLGNMSNNIPAFTIAQFLTHQGFYNWEEMKAFLPNGYTDKQYAKAKNIIIDECSMITTNDFYVLLQAIDLSHVERIILIGDPFQLPPIGEGRTFADLYNFLDTSENENIKSALAKLEIVVRNINYKQENKEDEIVNSDVLTLASWFSGIKPDKEADIIFDKIEKGSLTNDLMVYTWDEINTLKDVMKTAIENELPGEGVPLAEKILSELGLINLNKALAKPDVVEKFQVLSPVLNPVWGTFEINRHFQEWTNHTNKNYCIEIASEFLHYGDKIMQLINEHRKSYPANVKQQLSNGQIGFMYETWKKDKRGKAAFSGYPNQLFYYNESKTDDKDSVIQLAYAITIHKSQGSDFDTVMVVLPKTGRILSKELIYTALTRTKKKLILLVEESPSWLFEFTKPSHSVLTHRNTNLFNYSVREFKDSIPYVEGLIHKASNGELFRSKSEVIIANQLLNHDIPFKYEKMLESDGHKCIPDFTFVDAGGDLIIWEHLGMLSVPSYAQAWQKKKEFYESIGFYEGENLFVSKDEENGGIDSQKITEIIRQLEDII